MLALGWHIGRILATALVSTCPQTTIPITGLLQISTNAEGLNTNLAPSGKRWKSGGVGIGGLALLVDRVARRRRARVAAAAR